jgi:hypothetical protein
MWLFKRVLLVGNNGQVGLIFSSPVLVMLSVSVRFGGFLIYVIEMAEVFQSNKIFEHNYSFSSGVFLIPYVIFLFLLGIPLFYLEINLGQFTSQGPVQCWRMAPIFKGYFL